MKSSYKELGKVCLTPEGEWDKNKKYDNISIVSNSIENKSYISKKIVPIGIDIHNIEYWQPIGSAGYKDNNIIIISDVNFSTGKLIQYSLKDAINSIGIDDRRPGLILGFYGLVNTPDGKPTWSMYQYNDESIANWNNINKWVSIYSNMNKFKGYYSNEEELNRFCINPTVGDYAYVGDTFLHAYVYRCIENRVWINSLELASDFLKIVLTGPSMNFPDEEDVTSIDNKIQFKNRSPINGMGYKIIRRTKSIKEQIEGKENENTIFEIRYNFDLNKETINIPSNCILKFNGGSFNNGTIIGNNSTIEANLYNNIFNDTNIKGTFNNYKCSICWFGAINSNHILKNNISCNDAINKCLNSSFENIYFPLGDWYIDKTINLNIKKDFILEGKSNDYPFNLKQYVKVNQCGTIYTDKNIEVLNIEYERPYSYYDSRCFINGGCIDVSLCKEYSNNVIHVTTINSQIWGLDIDTCLNGGINTTNGTAIFLDGTTGNGYITYININSIINYFNIAVNVDNRKAEGVKAWITDFSDYSQIRGCKQGIIINNVGVINLKGRYQVAQIFDEKDNNIPYIYLNGRQAVIDCTVWDIGLRNKNTLKYANNISVEISEESKQVYFGDRGVNLFNYFNKNTVKDNNNITENLSKYQQYNKSQYKTGYDDLDNFYIGINGFTSKYDSNCIVTDPENLFNPNANKITTIDTKGVLDPYFKVIIEYEAFESPLLIGFTMDNNSQGTFRKAELKYYNNQGIVVKTDTINNIATLDGGIINNYYFKNENIYAQYKKIELIFSNYIGINNKVVEIYSIFGKHRKKYNKYITQAGGNIFGKYTMTSKAKIESVSKKIVFDTKPGLWHKEDLDNYNLAATAYYKGRDNNNGEIITVLPNYKASYHLQNINYPRTIDKIPNNNILPTDKEYTDYIIQYDYTTNRIYLGRKEGWYYAQLLPINVKHEGLTIERPANVPDGFMYKDTTINKLIWKLGTNWVDANGEIVK